MEERKEDTSSVKREKDEKQGEDCVSRLYQTYCKQKEGCMDRKRMRSIIHIKKNNMKKARPSI